MLNRSAVLSMVFILSMAAHAEGVDGLKARLESEVARLKASNADYACVSLCGTSKEGKLDAEVYSTRGASARAAAEELQQKCAREGRALFAGVKDGEPVAGNGSCFPVRAPTDAIARDGLDDASVRF